MSPRSGGAGARRPARRSPGAAPFDQMSQADAEALADPTRFRLFDVLRRADGPMTVADLTAVVGVHHTAVRQHLAKLRDAGLVTEERAAPSGRGRPHLLYRIRLGQASGAGVSGAYQRLAVLLAAAVRSGRSAREVGREAGREVARETALEAQEPDQQDPVRIVVDEAERLGFRPAVEDTDTGVDVVLRHCPFRDVAADDPETVCSLHLGMAEGVAEEAGGLDVLGMVVNDPYRAGCRMQLRRTSD